MPKRTVIAFLVGQGIGNQVEMLPAFQLAKLKYPESVFVIVNTCPHVYWFTEYLFKNKDRVIGIYKKDEIPKNLKIDGRIWMRYTPDLKIKDTKNLTLKTFNHQEMIYNSEILTNIRCIEHGNTLPNQIMDVREFFPEDPNAPVPKYDIVVHNGRNTLHTIKGLWDIKLYPHFKELVKMFQERGFSVASIGTGDEHIEGTINETGKKIEKSIELIRKCKLFVANDTGTFHIAGAMRKKGIVLFTATSPWKNYDKHFHKSIELIRRTDLDCSPCQKKGNGHWLHCKIKEKCKDIPPIEIIKVADRLLKSKSVARPKVSLITRIYNRLEYTVDCIRGVHKLAGVDNYEHIIIDQGSTDGTVQWLRSIDLEKYYNVKLIFNEKNTGDALGVKQGYDLSSSDSKYIMQFDGDCAPLTNNFLDKLIDIMEADEKIGMLMMFREGVKNNLMPFNGSIKKIGGQQVGEIEKATCCFIIKKDLIKKMNHWKKNREDIGLGFEWSAKVKGMGYKICKAINVKVEHLNGTVLQAIKYPTYHNSRNSNKTNFRDVDYTK